MKPNAPQSIVTKILTHWKCVKWQCPSDHWAYHNDKHTIAQVSLCDHWAYRNDKHAIAQVSLLQILSWKPQHKLSSSNAKKKIQPSSRQVVFWVQQDKMCSFLAWRAATKLVCLRVENLFPTHFFAHPCMVFRVAIEKSKRRLCFLSVHVLP